MNVVFYWFYFLVILKMKNESFLDVAICIHMVSLICLDVFVKFVCLLFEGRSNIHFFYIQISDFLFLKFISPQ